MGTVAASVLALGGAPSALAASAGSHQLPHNARFYTGTPDAGAMTQITDLLKKHDFRDAALIARMVTTPQSVWFTSGAPADVHASVRKTVEDAARRHTIPVLVAYDIPFRDCSQYSAGGALSTADYEAWIDGFASGIGNRPAVVLLEPDSLGIIPWNTDINGNAEWCTPKDSTGGHQPGASPAERYAALNGVPLLDAYLWVKIPGESDGSCDIAGGARAWDYTAYNPWGLSGDAQLHFDPLWGQADSAAGAWFPAQALQLAQEANPPLMK